MPREVGCFGRVSWVSIYISKQASEDQTRHIMEVAEKGVLERDCLWRGVMV